MVAPKNSISASLVSTLQVAPIYSQVSLIFKHPILSVKTHRHAFCYRLFWIYLFIIYLLLIISHFYGVLLCNLLCCTFNTHTVFISWCNFIVSQVDIYFYGSSWHFEDRRGKSAASHPLRFSQLFRAFVRMPTSVRHLVNYLYRVIYIQFRFYDDSCARKLLWQIHASVHMRTYKTLAYKVWADQSRDV